MKILPISHLDHGLSPEQVTHIVSRFSDRAGFFIETIELPTELGTVECGLYGPKMGDDPIPSFKVRMQRRGTRSWESRVIAMPTRPTRMLTVVAGPLEDKEEPCVLYTAYAGPAAPQEPDDPRLADSGRYESIDFWSTHALALRSATNEEVLKLYAEAEDLMRLCNVALRKPTPSCDAEVTAARVRCAELIDARPVRK